MAITAVETQTGNMVLMTEWDWLVRSDVLIGHIGRALELKQRGAHRGQQKNRSQNAGPGQGICTAVEKLCHGSCSREIVHLKRRQKSACGQQPPFVSRFRVRDENG